MSDMVTANFLSRALQRLSLWPSSRLKLEYVASDL